MKVTKTKIQLLTTTEVADLTGFSSRTIARWCRQGEFLEFAFKVGRVWRVDSRVIQYLKDRP
jgi:excisionase family DNA binding protein